VEVSRDAVEAPAIEIRDLIRVYQDGDVETIALRGIDLRIEQGEFVAIVGRSGSGKSTLLNLLSGSDRPTAGQVAVGGVALERADEADRERLRGRTVGIVFQSRNLADILTLEENVAMAARLAGRDPAGAQLAIERVGLAERATHRPSQLSGGEQQRAALAMVLAAQPQIILGDEITGELDSETAGLLLELVTELHRWEHLTIVLVTHDEAVAAHADRVIELRDGRVVRDHATAEDRPVPRVQPKERGSHAVVFA
jgi:putative ABC transport system ATP-binding protein